MDWKSLQYFLALSETGSLSGAAQALNVEHATVARRITDLERSLNTDLVDRRGRRWVINEAGQNIISIAQRMAKDAQTIERLAEGGRDQINGQITISAPPALATFHLSKPLSILQKRYPSLEIHLIGESRQASLEKREADIAIRLSRPTQGDLTIVKLGQMNFRAYGTSDYLAYTKEENWQFVGYNEKVPQQIALEKYAGDRRFSFFVNSVELQHSLAASGAGIAILPDFMVDRTSNLVPVAPSGPVFSREIWLITHSEMKNAAHIRTVTKFLQETFKQVET